MQWHTAQKLGLSRIFVGLRSELRKEAGMGQRSHCLLRGSGVPPCGKLYVCRHIVTHTELTRAQLLLRWPRSVVQLDNAVQGHHFRYQSKAYCDFLLVNNTILSHCHTRMHCHGHVRGAVVVTAEK